MTDWVALTSNELGADKVLTAPTAQALFDNPSAIAEGASGAPRVQTAGIGDAAVTTAKIGDQQVTEAKIADNSITPVKLQGGGVGQAHLHTSSGTVSTGGSQALALPGGQYGFYPRIQGTTPSAHIAGGNSSFGSFTTTVFLVSAGSTVQASQRYVTASPPFDLGEGEVLGFVFLLMRGGRPVASYAADVPPWAYNGPTDIRPDRIDDGRKLRRVPKRRALHAALCRGDLSLGEYGERARSAEYCGSDWVEIDQALKQADMPLVPHPFASADEGDVVVLLDPMDRLIDILLEAQLEGEDLGELLLSGRIRPDSEPLRRRGPPGVLQCKIRG